MESELSPVACRLHNSQPCHDSQTFYTHFTPTFHYTHFFFTLRTLLYTQITFSIQVPQLSSSRVANIPSIKHCENSLKAWSIFHYMRWNFYWKHCPDLSHLEIFWTLLRYVTNCHKLDSISNNSTFDTINADSNETLVHIWVCGETRNKDFQNYRKESQKTSVCNCTQLQMVQAVWSAIFTVTWSDTVRWWNVIMYF